HSVAWSINRLVAGCLPISSSTSGNPWRHGGTTPYSPHDLHVGSASILLLGSCVNAHNPLGTIHRQEHAVLDHGRPHDRTNHTRQAILSGNNGTVTEDTTRIRHHGADCREQRGPGWHGHLAHQDFPRLNFAGLGQIVHDFRPSLHRAGRGSGAGDDVGV